MRRKFKHAIRVLRAVHAGDASTRADITRVLDIHTATVCATVSALMDAGALANGEPRASRAGGREVPLVVTERGEQILMSEVVPTDIEPHVVAGMRGHVYTRRSVK